MAGIECFIPSMSGEDISVTVESFSRSAAFTGVTILSGVSLKCTETLRSIAEAVHDKYVLLYLKDMPLEMGMLALDRVISIAEDTKAERTVLFCSRTRCFSVYRTVNDQLVNAGSTKHFNKNMAVRHRGRTTTQK
jgi:hypothetical protein